MNIKEKIEEIFNTAKKEYLELIENELIENDFDSFYDNENDDYYEDQVESAYDYAEDIIPGEFSPLLLKLLRNHSLDEIFNDSTLYIFGYEFESYVERVLASSKFVYSDPFGAILICKTFGIATRFELVSNDYIFAFCSGGIGTNHFHPMMMSNNILAEGVPLHVSKFEINLEK